MSTLSASRTYVSNQANVMGRTFFFYSSGLFCWFDSYLSRFSVLTKFDMVDD